MTVYAIHQTTTGELVSVGTIVADPLPAGLTSVALSDPDYVALRDNTGIWDTAVRAVVPNPAYAAEQTRIANEAALRTDPQTHIDALVAAVASLQAVVDTANATINANPAATLKNVAREVMTVARRTVRLARLELGVTDSTAGT